MKFLRMLVSVTLWVNRHQPENIYLRMAQLIIGDALKAFLEKSKLKNGIRAVQIEEVWEKVMGKTIAKYTDKIEIINSKLFIYSSVGPLKNELQYQKPQIIQRVNELMGDKVISEVVIK
jgi:hypothetical protein